MGLRVARSCSEAIWKACEWLELLGSDLKACEWLRGDLWACELGSDLGGLQVARSCLEAI